MRKNFISAAVLFVSLACSPRLAAQAAPAPPPKLPFESLAVPAERLGNLGELKQLLKKYYACTCDCGCYEKEAELQSARAIEFLRSWSRSAKPGQKAAIVLDIDDTALSNYPLYSTNDFSHVPAEFDRWVLAAKAPAVPSVLAIFNAARHLGISVFFITGRPEQQRDATEQNLLAAGYKEWAGLTMRTPADIGKPAAEYKPAARQKLVSAGYVLVLNVGDQFSDLAGDPAAALSVKMPNPMYFLP